MSINPQPRAVRQSPVIVTKVAETLLAHIHALDVADSPKTACTGKNGADSAAEA